MTVADEIQQARREAIMDGYEPSMIELSLDRRPEVWRSCIEEGEPLPPPEPPTYDLVYGMEIHWVEESGVLRVYCC